jgi:hypothetical protein
MMTKKQKEREEWHQKNIEAKRVKVESIKNQINDLENPKSGFIDLKPPAGLDELLQEQKEAIQAHEDAKELYKKFRATI